jgi:DNA-binding NtrC family response regulator
LDDIPLLVEHFTHIISENQGMPLRTFNKDAYEVLKKLPWKGNIRELHNIVERLMILCDNPITGADVTKYTRHS